MMRRQRLFPVTHDEAGNTLALALAIIIVVSVAGAAVLNQIAAAPQAQKAQAAARNDAAYAERVADAAVGALRFDRNAGLSRSATGSTGPCSANVQPDGTVGTDAELRTANGAMYSANDFKVYCAAAASSGDLKGSAGEAPPNSLLALGGMNNRGSYAAAPAGMTPNAPVQLAPNESTVAINQNPNQWLPFCDDFHSSGEFKCETGIYLGRGTTTSEAGGGLTIAPNGSLSTTEPVVRSNSGIIVSTYGNPDRQLGVAGNVLARRGCGGYNRASNVFTPSPPSSSVLLFGTSTTAPTLTCANSYLGTNWDNVGLKEDPLFVHAPIDLSMRCSGSLPSATQPTPDSERCVPRINNSNRETKFRLPTNLCDYGYVVMPAQKIGISQSGTQLNKEMYAAWYDSAADLNALMDACRDTLFYFRPGVYYFDFLDNDGATKWIAPVGYFPVNSSNHSTAIVGGSPQGWTAPAATATSISDHAVQSDKVLITNKNDVSIETYWSEGAESANIDGIAGTTRMYQAGDHQSATVTQRALQTPLPQKDNMWDPSYKIKLSLEISYDLPSGGPGATPNYRAYYDRAPSALDPTPGGTFGGGLLEIKVPNDAGSCYIWMPGGYHSEVDKSTQPNRVPGMTSPDYDPAQLINLDNGCPDLPGNAQGTLPRTVQKTGFFNTFTQWTPADVNSIKAVFRAWATSSTTKTDPADVSMDGIQFVATYKGRPSPPFPEGCDNTSPGVQFIFGGASRMEWGGSTRNAFVELCATAQKRFPNWIGPEPAGLLRPGSRCATTMLDADCAMTGGGNKYNVAVYGVTPNNPNGDQFKNPNGPGSKNTGTADNYDIRGSGPIHTIRTGDLPSTATPCDTTAAVPHPNLCTRTTGTQSTSAAYNNGADGTFGNADDTGGWLSTDPANVKKVDGTSATAIWKGTANQTMVFRLPNMICAQTDWPNCPSWKIPQGSTITGVQFKLRHREGEWEYDTPATPDITKGTFYPTKGAVEQNIKTVNLTLKAGEAGLGSNGMTGNNYGSSTATDKPGMNDGNGIPLSTSTNTNSCDSAYYCTYVYGDPRGHVAGDPNSSTDLNASWTLQRDLMRDYSTPESIGGGGPAYNGSTIKPTGTTDSSGAEISIEFVTAAGTPTRPWHRVDLDGFELIVSYRAAGELRPLRGCLTSRTEWAPGQLVIPDPDDALGSPAGISAKPGYRWLAEDWGVNKRTDPQALDVDDPFTSPAQASAGGNGTSDSAPCALIELENSSPNVKFHVQGLVYAPSAALYLTGYDNDSSWATDGLIARQITAFKWKDGGGHAAIGGTSPPRENRKVTIEVRDSTGTRVLVRRVVQFDDNYFEAAGGESAIGRGVSILSHVTNPS
jgi:hypothetical protein